MTAYASLDSAAARPPTAGHRTRLQYTSLRRWAHLEQPRHVAAGRAPAVKLLEILQPFASQCSFDSGRVSADRVGAEPGRGSAACAKRWGRPARQRLLQDPLACPEVPRAGPRPHRTTSPWTASALDCGGQRALPATMRSAGISQTGLPAMSPMDSTHRRPSATGIPLNPGRRGWEFRPGRRRTPDRVGHRRMLRPNATSRSGAPLIQNPNFSFADTGSTLGEGRFYFF